MGRNSEPQNVEHRLMKSEVGSPTASRYFMILKSAFANLRFAVVPLPLPPSTIHPGHP